MAKVTKEFQLADALLSLDAEKMANTLFSHTERVHPDDSAAFHEALRPLPSNLPMGEAFFRLAKETQVGILRKIVKLRYRKESREQGGSPQGEEGVVPKAEGDASVGDVAGTVAAGDVAGAVDG